MEATTMNPLKSIPKSVSEFFGRDPLPTDREGAEKALKDRRRRLEAERKQMREQERRTRRLAAKKPTDMSPAEWAEGKREAAGILQEHKAAVRQAEKEVARAESHLEAVKKKRDRAREKARKGAEKIRAEIEAKARALNEALQVAADLNEELCALEKKAFRHRLKPDLGARSPNALGRNPLYIGPLLRDPGHRFPGTRRTPSKNMAGFESRFRKRYGED